MIDLSSTALLGLTLLAAPVSATERVPLPACAMGTRYVELDADASSRALELCIRPELSLSLFFDTELARVDVEGRERFRRVEVGTASLTLVATEALHDGARAPVTVYFEDGAAPESASFTLVVHPSQAERQVEVSRQARTVASYRQGEQQAQAEARQCREEMARLRLECGGQGGLTGPIFSGWLGERGIGAKELTHNITQNPEEPLKMREAISYRAVGPKGRGRVAMEVLLFNEGTEDWTPVGAALEGSKREAPMELRVWPLEPIPPGEARRIVVEREATKDELRGTFTLKLWTGEGGAGSVNLDGVTFP